MPLYPLPQDQSQQMQNLRLSDEPAALTRASRLLVAVEQTSEQSHAHSDMSLQSDESSNMSSATTNFDPDRSNRETRKLVRKIYTERKYHAVYDSTGVNVVTGRDSCDCLDDKCEGCHFPCQRCRSLKCGHECRQNRRWQYEPDFETERLPWTKVPLESKGTAPEEAMVEDQDCDDY